MMVRGSQTRELLTYRTIWTMPNPPSPFVGCTSPTFSTLAGGRLFIRAFHKRPGQEGQSLEMLPERVGEAPSMELTLPKFGEPRP